MNITLLIGIAVLIIVILLALKIIKGTLKFIFSIIGALLILILILGGLAYMDGKQAQTLMEEGNKTILYMENNEVLAGVIITEGGMMIEGEGELPTTIIALNDKELQQYNPHNETDELIIFITNESFENIETINISEYNITKEAYEEIMQSEEPKETLIEIILEEKNMNNEAVTDNLKLFKDEELKATLFLMAFSQQAQTEGGTFLLQNLKEGNIIIRPEFMTLKIMNWLPDKLFTKALEKTFKLTNKEDEA